MSGQYEKMSEYIQSVFTVFLQINKKAKEQNNKRTGLISMLIYKYVLELSKEHNVSLNNIEEKSVINLVPIFEYISYKNIELLDFSKIEINDIDVSKPEDVERFVLTHIYYLTQK